MEEMIIFTRTYELLTWLIPRCDAFPKAQRTIVTKRLQDALLDFQESVFDANVRSGVARAYSLTAADGHLNKLRLYLRLAYQFDWLTAGQYEHVSRMVLEIGRLLGGWIKQTEGRQRGTR
ncbi:MAG: diversity-generating retroelement protein Avd [Chloroflexota bacterium]